MESGNGKNVEVSSLGTYLGRYPVPIISSCQGMLTMINKFRDDEPFITAILERSVIDFSRKEEGLKDRVIKDAETKKNFGCSVLFERSLAEFEKALRMRMELEIELYKNRKAVQSKIYDILVQSAFPYSKKQVECIHRIRGVVDHISGNPEAETDKVIVASVRELMELMRDDDHLSDTTPFRVVLWSSVPFHLNKLRERLIPVFTEEMNMRMPDCSYPMATTHTAGYMVARIESLMEVNKLMAPHEHFHLGMSEIYDKLMRIFKLSGLRFNDQQELAFENVERETRILREEPRMPDYEGVDKAWREFMNELGKAVLPRELSVTEDGRLEFAIYGPVNMIIRDTNWRLVHLMAVANAHILSFPLFTFGMENMAAIVTGRFLTLYPMR